MRNIQNKKPFKAPRCTLAEDDFFQPVPAGAVMYLIKLILHDRDEQRSIEFLKTAVPLQSPKRRF